MVTNASASVSPTTQTGADSHPPTTGPRILDSAALLSRCLGNVQLAERVLQRFAAEFPRDLNQLETLSAAGEGEQIRGLAHRLKGSAANVAADRLTDCLAEIELLGSLGKLSEITAALHSLTDEFERFRGEEPTWRSEVAARQ